jgi:hypothetical protein
MHDYQRPPTLYRYGRRAELEQALATGQLRLIPANNCLTFSLSQAWDKDLFDAFDADACLVIHNTEEFGERLHKVKAALGAAFTKTVGEEHEQEWQFAWRSLSPQATLNPVTVRIGSLEQYAELRTPDSYSS